MLKQKDISKILSVHQSDVSRILNRKKAISWPLAEKLATIFPGKTISQWKRAKPEELKQAFGQMSEYSDLKSKKKESA